MATITILDKKLGSRTTMVGDETAITIQVYSLRLCIWNTANNMVKVATKWDYENDEYEIHYVKE